MRLRLRHRGFTLVELMIVVAIVGILASMAIPAFMNYVRKAKSTEAVQNVRRLYESGKSYLLEESSAEFSTIPIDKQFPVSEALTPAASCCSEVGQKCVPVSPVWETPTWAALHFAMTDSHYYRYAWDSVGPGPGSAFTARALGDLDCDGVFATFEMVGIWSTFDHDVHGSASLHIERDVE